MATNGVDLGNRRVRQPVGKDASSSSPPANDRVANARARRAEAEGEPASDMVQRRPPPETTLKTQTQKVAAIAELLRNGFDDAGEGDDAGELGTADSTAGDDGPEAEQTKSRKIDDIAEALGVDLAELWESTEYTDPRGNTRKLGELKDLATANVDHDARELEFLTRKSAGENELMVQRQELDYILRNIPKAALTPELKARAVAERDRIVKEQRALTVKAIPAWSNAATEKKDRAAIAERMRQYGYTATDLERFHDHRMLKLLHDYTELRARVDDALAKKTEDKSGDAAPARRRARTAPPVRLGPNATRTQKVAAVAQLLRTGLPTT